MSTSGKETVISSIHGRCFTLFDKIMEENTKSKRVCYWALRSEVRKIFESGQTRGNVEYFVGRQDSQREIASYLVTPSGRVMIGCCDFIGEDAAKLQEWAVGKKNKNEENGRMITVMNDCEERFALGATEMRQLPNGYKMQRKDLKAAMESYKRGRYMEVPYGFTDGNDVRVGTFTDGDDAISIGCCNFNDEEAHKLRKWAMAERKSNGSTGTRKRTGAGKNSKRKATPRNTRNASRARTNKARPRKTAVAGGAKRTGR